MMRRRKLDMPARQLLFCLWVACIAGMNTGYAEAGTQRVERWDVFELELTGPTAGNPYLDVILSAQFSRGNTRISVPGFYDGDGRYKIRFSPPTMGRWTYVTSSNASKLNGETGSVTAASPANGNHGPIEIFKTFYLRYTDGTPYHQFGTTCYAWIHQTQALQEQTLKTLAASPFNKIRFCVFPKHYSYNRNEPELFAFEKKPNGKFDFRRPDPAFWRHLEQRILDLQKLGIEADIIIWHPYDRWGFADMSDAEDDRYLRYCIARLAAYRNVWWSMANEYDFLLKRKPMSQWDRFFEILRDNDPYAHLRSIHNGDAEKNYDHTKPWITHVCIQNWDVKRARAWRKAYQKPVINDECEYEGNIPMPWGNISARELVHRFWIMCTNGCYAGHGETYAHPEQILWWSKGGVLKGESWQRVGFLKEIMEQGPPGGLTPIGDFWIWSRVSGGMNRDYRLIYFGTHQPKIWFYGKPKQGRFKVDVIDTWNMTVTPQQRIYQHNEEIPLPGKPYLAIRIRPEK